MFVYEKGTSLRQHPRNLHRRGSVPTFPRGNGNRETKTPPEVGMAPRSGRRLALVVHFFDLFDRQFLHTIEKLSLLIT